MNITSITLTPNQKRNDMTFDRTQAVDEAKKKSARADMKQHADKLIQGFENLNESHARRAIWELVQNACDLSNDCEIIIDFSKGDFSFNHNGKPFNSETLISLLKQVSSKAADQTDEVGQFGTGFITTHSFGKTINLNSVLQEDETYIGIEDFKIDRRAKNSDELVEKLVTQESMVYELIEKGSIINNPAVSTTFTYISEQEQDKENIKQAEDNLDHYIPSVLALNDSLKSVKVISSSGTETFYKKELEESFGDIVKIPVLKNGVSEDVFCVRSDDKNIQIILPLSSINISNTIGNSTAKLFLFFPLIGTEAWGCNFIIHSKLFCATEQRDGLHLQSNNSQTAEKEKSNRIILDKASEIIINFVSRHSENISDVINLARVNFDTINNTESINNYFKWLKEKWVNQFKIINLVETKQGRKTPLEIHFIAPELLLDKSYYDSIYEIVSKFWKNQIPKKEVAQEWTTIVTEWEDLSISFISIEMLVSKIQNEVDLARFNEQSLFLFYEYLLKYSGLNHFEDYKLLPNIKNELTKKGDLKQPINIDPIYIQILDTLVPEIPKKYIKENFDLKLEYGVYNRKNLSEDLNTKIISMTKDLTSNSEQFVDDNFRNALIQLCSIFPAENSISTRRQIMPVICKFYTINFREFVIPNIENQKIDYDYTPFKSLIRIFLLDILKKSKIDVNWVKQEITFLRDSLNILTSHRELDDIMDSIPVFPNQNYVLCSQVSLKIEKDFPKINDDCEFLKETYGSIIQDIKKELVLNEFKHFLNHSNEQTGLELSGKLEQVFKINGSYEDILNHPNKGIIFKIVQKITDNKEWSTFFTALDEKKAIIMMAKISDPGVRDNLFSIIGIEDKAKLALLGDLSRNPEFERIISLGKEAVELEKQNDADFLFKKKIGTHIEDLIRNKLQKEVIGLKLDINEEQRGQDIVVKLNGEKVYFIEVKSRWDNNNSIRMSNTQIKKAASNKERYSLCCIEMCDYYPIDGNRHQISDVNEILDRIKFINDIGKRIEPLIANAIKAEADENEVQLTNEYRAIIPQVIVKNGVSLEEFVNHLIQFLHL